MAVLLSEDGEQALQIALDIAADIELWMDAGGVFADDSDSSGELASQNAGICLLFLELNRATGNACWRRRAESCWARSVDRIGRTQSGPDFFTGFPGAAWVGALLEESSRLPDSIDSNSEDDDDDAYSEVDSAVSNALSRSVVANADLLGGLSGLGLYLASRLPRRRAIDALEQLVSRLDESALTDRRGIYWTPQLRRLPPGFDRTRFSEGCIPLGVAHGIAGILSVVSRAKAAGVAAEVSARLLDGGAQFLLASRLPSGSPLRFPASLHKNGTVAAPAGSWCWGDIGIVGALYFAAVRAGHLDLEKAMVEAAIDAAKVLPISCSVCDSSLCHGTAGRAHILNRLYQCTGLDPLAAASREWFRATVAARHKDGIGGYQFLTQSGGVLRAHSSPGLLVGSAGVALALLAGTSGCQPFWDMPFGTDGPMASATF